MCIRDRENNFEEVKDMHALMKSLSSGLVGRKQEVKDKEELQMCIRDSSTCSVSFSQNIVLMNILQIASNFIMKMNCSPLL